MALVKYDKVKYYILAGVWFGIVLYTYPVIFPLGSPEVFKLSLFQLLVSILGRSVWNQKNVLVII